MAHRLPRATTIRARDSRGRYGPSASVRTHAHTVRDPTKDQTIVLLYLIAVLGLLLVAFLRSRVGHAMLARARRVLRL